MTLVRIAGAPLAAGMAALLLTSCGGRSTAGDTDVPTTPVTTSAGVAATPRPTPTPTPRPIPQPAPAPTATPSRTGLPGPTRITKLLVVLVENHSLDAMRREMPYTVGLAERYGYATAYRAITHPSLPNYLAISAGDTFGIADDQGPGAHPIRTGSVFGEAIGRGLTATVYAEDMPGTCATSNSQGYAVRHNPWTYHIAERAACSRHDVPLTRLAGDVRTGRLPNAGMVVPNVCHDAHDCPAAQADAWMRSVMGDVLGGPDFRSGRLLVVITADEDAHDQGNRVLTTLVTPQLHRAVVRSPLDHYSLSRLYSEVLGAPPLRRAATAASVATAFRLSVGPAPAG
jgi:acid phosphatase